MTTLTQKLEDLPEDFRERFAKYLNEHFEDLKNELLWDEQSLSLEEKERSQLETRLQEYHENPTEGIEWDALKAKLIQTK